MPDERRQFTWGGRSGQTFGRKTELLLGALSTREPPDIAALDAGAVQLGGGNLDLQRPESLLDPGGDVEHPVPAHIAFVTRAVVVDVGNGGDAVDEELVVGAVVVIGVEEYLDDVVPGNPPVALGGGGDQVVG